MKKKKRLIFITIILIIILCNIPPISYFLLRSYHYSNKDHSFTFTEPGGPTQNFYVAMKKFDSFKIENPSNTNTVLYRKFELQPWRFWEWREMIINPERFSLPYLSD